MKVLMFGWEFPPKIYGGLAVASYGITKGLSLQGDMPIFLICMAMIWDVRRLPVVTPETCMKKSTISP